MIQIKFFAGISWSNPNLSHLYLKKVKKSFEKSDFWLYNYSFIGYTLCLQSDKLYFLFIRR